MNFKQVFDAYINQAICENKDFKGTIRERDLNIYFTYESSIQQYFVYMEMDDEEGYVLTDDMAHQDLLYSLENETLVRFVVSGEFDYELEEEKIDKFLKRNLII